MITLSVADVSKTFKQAAGPDGLPGRVLRACADQLAGVFTDIFNMSLIQSVIPTCFKQTTIVPVPKNKKATCLNDYRPVALTSVAMKCFERLVMAHIITIIPETLDPLPAPTEMAASLRVPRKLQYFVFLRVISYIGTPGNLRFHYIQSGGTTEYKINVNSQSLRPGL